MAKPTVFDELYPGRFLKAGLLKGGKPTLTIKDVDVEELTGEDNKPKKKAIVSFEERPMELVICKTNGLSIKAMFGAELKNWIGKRVTLFQGQWNGEECIRVWGSPDIDKSLDVAIVLPRRKPFNMTMHKVVLKKGAQAEATHAENIDPRILTAWQLLLWSREEGERDMQAFAGSQADYLTKVNALLDAEAITDEVMP